MENFQKALEILEEVCGSNKDNALSLAKVKEDGGIYLPFVRDVSAYYNDGSFYVTTHALSNKIKQLELNDNIAFGVHFEGVSGSGKRINLGWVMKPENSELRLKLREVFAPWYDFANNEEDENCCILKIDVNRVRVFRDEGKINLEFFK